MRRFLKKYTDSDSSISSPGHADTNIIFRSNNVNMRILGRIFAFHAQFFLQETSKVLVNHISEKHSYEVSYILRITFRSNNIQSLSFSLLSFSLMAKDSPFQLVGVWLSNMCDYWFNFSLQNQVNPELSSSAEDNADRLLKALKVAVEAMIGIQSAAQYATASK